MKRVLVLGGYGGFGGRVSRLLGRRGYEVLVAGRSLDRAEAFCAEYGALQLRPVRLDRTADLALPLNELQPWLVVDAAGPFQGNDYRIPESCIAAGCHYADLADARDFVSGIEVLDARAREAGISLIAGASSVPALTSAAADRLAAGLDRLSVIDIALSASNRASGSRSVTAAILSYVGRPIRLWRGGRWREGFGWQEMEKLRLGIGDRAPIRRRVALCDVPDLSLLPERYPGRPAVRFRAGTELDVQNIGLWLMSWPVRWGWLRSLTGLAALGVVAQRLLRRFGGDRSAMHLLVKGWAGEQPLTRSWVVFAEEGDGPWIPSLAVPLIADELAEGRFGAGARPAAGLVDLEAFERVFLEFAIGTGVTEERCAPLYARLMGDGFAGLPTPVRALHEVHGELTARGRGEVVRGGMLSRLVGGLFHLPPAGTDVAVSLWIREEHGVETWYRDFGGHCFSSRLSAREGLLVERFGVIRFGMELRNEAGGLSMHIRRWWLGPVRMPLALAPRIRANEFETRGMFHFQVEIRLPVIGQLISYRGQLTRTAEA